MADLTRGHRSLSASSRLSHDVRIWSIARYKGARGTTYTVRWLVAGESSQKTFTSHKLADGFRTALLVAAREGRAFEVSSGLPVTMLQPREARSWFEHAMDYSDMKWPNSSPRHRKGIAEALVALTLAYLAADPDVDAADLRRALFRSAFNAPARRRPLPDEFLEAITRVQETSIPLLEVAKPQLLRVGLDVLSRTLDGQPAAASTFARKRATFNNALEYAVELELLPDNPLRRLRRRSQSAEQTVDRRVVVNPDQARALLLAVRDRDPTLAGFFACLYFAGLRPAEARNLRVTDCALPEEGWGELVLQGSHQEAGTAWTDSGHRSEERVLKHRLRGATRRVPAHPELVAVLRWHLDSFATGADGRLFVSRTGRAGVPLPPPYLNPVAMNTVYRAWHRAREAVFTAAKAESPLARRPYDLRHACLSTWLNAGVPPAQVAQWAGHSVQVLLRVYAKCLDGQETVAKHRIEAALRSGPTSERIPSEQPQTLDDTRT